MSLEIRSPNIEISNALRTYIERRLSFVLRKFQTRSGRLTVRLSDLNGPRGGVDKRCQISAHVIPSQTVLLQAVDADLYSAIDRASARLERSLAHILGRVRESRRGRKSIRKPSALTLQVPWAPARLEDLVACSTNTHRSLNRTAYSTNDLPAKQKEDKP